MRIAFVGCGFVADLYARTLELHPDLELAGVYDADEQRAGHFSGYWSTRAYGSLGQLLEDPAIRIVVNLTPPKAHADISRDCLRAGKHVYSEKPLAMQQGEARDLVDLAREQGLWITSAPCTLLEEAAQTTWRALREGRIGRVGIAYAEMDDGLVHKMPYRRWRSVSGAPWPYRSEFETGCTLEHAGYQVSWLVAFFGPARRVTALSSVQVADKELDPPLESTAPDCSIAAIRFDSGVVARLTCTILAPRDHRLRLVGEKGVLTVSDTWHRRSPVYHQRWITLRNRTFPSWPGKRLRLAVSPGARVRRRGASQIDFLAGVSDLARAISENRCPRLSPEFCLHVNEVVLAIHNATENGAAQEISSTFEPVEPMEWAAT
jgi:predicted dehydrogenase